MAGFLGAHSGRFAAKDKGLPPKGKAFFILSVSNDVGYLALVKIFLK